jgi:hypothetical protein
MNDKEKEIYLILHGWIRNQYGNFYFSDEGHKWMFFNLNCAFKLSQIGINTFKDYALYYTKKNDK